MKGVFTPQERAKMCEKHSIKNCKLCFTSEMELSARFKTARVEPIPGTKLAKLHEELREMRFERKYGTTTFTRRATIRELEGTSPGRKKKYERRKTRCPVPDCTRKREEKYCPYHQWGAGRKEIGL